MGAPEPSVAFLLEGSVLVHPQVEKCEKWPHIGGILLSANREGRGLHVPTSMILPTRWSGVYMCTVKIFG